jgi:hypothetical protein
MRKLKEVLAENVPANLMIECGEQIELAEIAAGKDEKKPKRFKMNAYNGGMMELGGWYLPVIVDLEGMSVPKRQRPILRGHDTAQIVGHSDKITIADGKMHVEGVVSETTAAGREVAGLAAEGFPWQASINARVTKVVRKEEGEKATVNGQEFVGPLLIARKSVLGEVSFVPLGADGSTSATVAASAAGAKINVEQENVMPKTKQEQEVEATGAQEQEVEAPVVEKTDEVAKIRAEAARIASINVVCKAAPEIAAQAVKDGWSPEKTELHVLKAAQARKEQDAGIGSPPITAETKNADLQSMKAGFMVQCGVAEKTIEAQFGKVALDKSDRYRRMRLKEVLALAASLDGVQIKHGMSERDFIAAAFSSISVTELLSDSANKSLLAAYNAVPAVARLLAKALSANDFKTHKGVRLTGDLVFKKVENAGEITHGTLGEDSFRYSLDTYGRMIGLTRQDLINDDLGAFLQLPQMFGRGSALMVENLFWTLVLANTGSFFSAGNLNYANGTDTALSIDSLSAAEELMAEQVDTEGQPIMVMGKYLVVPPALSAVAQQINKSTNLIDGTSSAKQGEANIHAGKYAPVMSPYLKGSPKVWYLWGDPMDVAAFGIAWLNGVQTPTIEEVPVSGEYLGRAWRGYLDVGVCQIDKRGAVKMKGEA